jgi:hypothetical protein
VFECVSKTKCACLKYKETTGKRAVGLYFLLQEEEQVWEGRNDLLRERMTSIDDKEGASRVEPLVSSVLSSSLLILPIKTSNKSGTGILTHDLLCHPHRDTKDNRLYVCFACLHVCCFLALFLVVSFVFVFCLRCCDESPFLFTLCCMSVCDSQKALLSVVCVAS